MKKWIKYRIFGADTDTGEDISVDVLARDVDHAEQMAKNQHVIASSIVPMSDDEGHPVLLPLMDVMKDK